MSLMKRALELGIKLHWSEDEKQKAMLKGIEACECVDCGRKIDEGDVNCKYCKLNEDDPREDR